MPCRGEERASGYLVAPGKVLTAAHALKGESGVQVRFDADRPAERKYPATVAWSNTDADIAVLEFDPRGAHEGADGPYEPEQTDVRASFGKAGEGTEEIDCTVAGFPLFKLRDSRYRDSEHGFARCAPFSNRREGTLDLRMSSPPSSTADPRPREDAEEPHAAHTADDSPSYEPWEGMSGAAVISAGRIIGVVVNHHRADGGRLAAARIDRLPDHLTTAELDYLASLLGCESLHPDDLPDVSLRLPEGVRTHRQELARSAIRDKYLTDSQIRFVSPGDKHKAEPDRILERLSAAAAPGAKYDSLGVLLVGVAGTGKTRTCFEVAARAERKGWFVLHIGADTPVPAEQLAATVGSLSARGKPVLLVLDYLDSYSQLGLAEFGQKLEELPTAASVRVACIASARPGSVQSLQRRGQLHFFDRVDVCQDKKFQDDVAEGIVAKAAPEAVAEYGITQIAEVCGSRPVLALLIAKAIESHVRDGVDDALSLPGLRNDRGLSRWLQQRTGEDFKHRQTSLLASAVAAASCTQDGPEVKRAVGSFLERHDDREFMVKPVGVVGRLLKLGWLLSSDGTVDGELDVVHDFVADELLQQALLPDPLQLEGVVAERMFSAFLATTRTFRLAADHVRRWSADLDPMTRDEVRQTCEDWLASPSPGDGSPGEGRGDGLRDGCLEARLAAETDLAESARTLLTLLSGPPWQSGVVLSWDRLVEPWLRRAETEAPHLAHTLFAHAVRNTSDAVPERLAAAALDWQAQHPARRRETRSVLEALLRATGLAAEQRSTAALRAVEWFETHGLTWDGRPLISALLARDDLDPDVAERAVGIALTVASRHLGAPPTAHVLRPLLRRGAPEPGRPDEAYALAVAWLKRHRSADVASFVLAELLVREDLDEKQSTQVTDRALNWLTAQGPSPVASFVLRRLLGRQDLRGSRAGLAADLAVGWLAKHGTDQDATYVLQPLLPMLQRCPPDEDGAAAGPTDGTDDGTDAAEGSTEATEGRTDQAVRHALEWLDAHRTRDDAHFVLRAVLEKPGLLREPAKQAAEAALVWLRTGAHGKQEWARSVLGPLLKYRGLPGAREHCAAAMRWLDAEPRTGSDETSFVLDPLLSQPALGKHAADAARHALAWLGNHGESPNAPFVLKPLLSLNISLDEPADEPADVRAGDREPVDPAVGAGLDWLATHGTSPVARFVLRPLLKHRNGGVRGAPHALAWLKPASNRTDTTASFVLGPLLTCPGLDADSASDAVEHALDWLDVHHGTRSAQWVLDPLLDRHLAGREPQRSRLVGRVLDCADDGHAALSRQRLRALCREDPLPGDLGTRIARHVLAEARSEESIGAVRLLAGALEREDVRTDEAGALVDLALERLRSDRYADSVEGRLLRALLSRTDLKAGPGGETVNRAMSWLGAHSSRPYAEDVMAALLEPPGGRPVLTPSQAEACARLAADWLDAAESTDEPGALRLAEILKRRR